MHYPDSTDSRDGSTTPLQGGSVLHFVHGTFARRSTWTTEGPGGLLDHLRPHFTGGASPERVTHEWSGSNSFAARTEDARRLSERLAAAILDNPHSRHYIVAHSHGGTVALHGISRQPSIARALNGIVLIATPFMSLSTRDLRFAGQASVRLLRLAAAVAILMAVLQTRPSMIMIAVGILFPLLGGLSLSLLSKWGPRRQARLLQELSLAPAPSGGKTSLPPLLLVRSPDDRVLKWLRLCCRVGELPFRLLSTTTLIAIDAARVSDWLVVGADRQFRSGTQRLWGCVVQLVSAFISLLIFSAACQAMTRRNAGSLREPGLSEFLSMLFQPPLLSVTALAIGIVLLLIYLPLVTRTIAVLFIGAVAALADLVGVALLLLVPAAAVGLRGWVVGVGASGPVLQSLLRVEFLADLPWAKAETFEVRRSDPGVDWTGHSLYKVPSAIEAIAEFVQRNATPPAGADRRSSPTS